MRLLRLELERYGHFTDKVIEFRPDACLHVVYGPNEAGKTSCLHAITDLLFGFGRVTQYGFLHENSKLSIGATIEAKDGARLTFKRRKGNKNTLLDAQGRPLGEEVLLHFLGSVSKEVFLNAFGLSKEALRAGAEEMLESGGEAGSSLIAAASGLKGLSELRKDLEQEASKIFAPTRAQHRTFYQAKDRHDEAARNIRQLELRDRDLKERLERIKTLGEELESVKEGRSRNVRRRELLMRQRAIGPLLLEIAADEDLLKSYEHLPAMESSRIAQIRSAYGKLEEATAELQRLNGELTGATATAGGYVVEAPLIALGPAITALHSESGNYTTLKTQLPRVQGEADGFKKKLDEYRVRLGLPVGSDLSQLRPSDMAIARAKERSNEGKGLERRLSALASAISKEQTEHDELVGRQANHVAAGDPKPLEDRLTRLMPTLSRLPEITRLERLVAKESGLLRERAMQLSPFVSDLDALSEMPIPSADTVAERIAIEDRFLAELTGLTSACSGFEKQLPALRAAVQSLEQEPLESTPERIAEVRLLRTSQWKPLRFILLKETDPPPVGETAGQIVDFEKSMDTSDRLADDAVQNADRIASRAAALNRLHDEEDRYAQALVLVNAKQEELAAFDAEWKKLWRTLGLVPSSPRKMDSWLSQLHPLLERRSALHEQSSDLAEVKQALTAVDPALKDLARVVGILEADKLSADLLLAAIQDELHKREDTWRDALEVVTLVEASDKRLEEFDSEQKELQKADREWKTSWTKVVSSLSLPSATTPDEASAALEIWQQVPSTLVQLDDRERRVNGMKRDIKGFEDRTAALFAQLGELEMAIGADAAIKTIAGRLTRAVQTESMAQMAKKRVNDLNSQIVTAEVTVENARQAFDSLASGLPSSEEPSEQIAELEERDSILKALRQQRHALLPLSRDQSEEELRSALQYFDDADAAAEIEELNASQAHLNQQENEIFANLRQAQDDLKSLQNGIGAELVMQQKKNAEAQLIQNAQEWAVKRIAQLLLTRAIEQFRSQQEAPLLKRASQLFSLLTAASFSGIEQEFDENDKVQLVGRRDAIHTVCIDGMSEGTRDQLYLALRLAYLEDYGARMEPLPFIGDDLLTNFDDGRTKRGIPALAAVGDHIQPILFTHHQHVMELAAAELGSTVDVIRLQ